MVMEGGCGTVSKLLPCGTSFLLHKWPEWMEGYQGKKQLLQMGRREGVGG